MLKLHAAFVRTSLLIFSLGSVCTAQAADWPTWGGNAARTGAVDSPLPETLYLNWKLQLREPDPAWHSNQDRVQFDRMYEPVVAGKRLFVGSMVSDRLTAYDTDTGKELWRFYTEGPVRLAPAVWNDNVYFACDDGNLYCLRTVDGSLLWKFHGAPLERKVLGNDRLISIYPARGAPVVYDGKVYFASSIWPFMGVFIHALDAATGNVVWTNSGTGSMYILQQHDRPAFAGIAPQGYLVATEDILLVSGGQTVPAAFDRHTGQFVHFNLNSREMGEKGGSGYHVRATQDFFVTNEHMFRMSDGAYLARISYPLITDKSLISVDASGLIHAYDHHLKIEKTNDRKGRATVKALLKERWNAAVEPKLNRLHLIAGSRVFGTSDDGRIAAVDLSEEKGDPKVSWTDTVDGDPLSLIAADGKLFVSTAKGTISCFAGSLPLTGSPVIIDETGSAPLPTAVSDRWNDTAKRIISESGANRGYCLLLGIGSGRLLEEMIAQSHLHVIAIDPDADKVRTYRQRLDDAGVYGTRACVLTGDILSTQLPPYLARIVISDDLDAAGIDQGKDFIKRLFEVIRPYGGVAYLPLSDEDHASFEKTVEKCQLAKAVVKRTSDRTHTIVARVGALPNSADWTHQYANAGNTVASTEALVKAPLGILWFGGPSNESVLPRHGHGPSPQVAGGRTIIEGRNMLRAVDVYTGQLLWERSFPDLGEYYDYTSHEPGANAIGSNYVSLDDNIYVIRKETCYRLDAATGETLGEFKAPSAAGEEGDPEWGYLSIVGDVLIGGVQPVHFKTHAFQFRELRKYDGDQGSKLQAEIRKWKNFEAIEPMGGGPVPAVLIENLNRLLFSEDFLAKIPREVREKAAATDLENKLKEYLAGGNDRDSEPSAIELKRHLLEKYYDLPRYVEGGIGTFSNLSRRSSRRLVGLNRRTGEVLWSVPARYAFRHNAIAAGNGKVFALDRLQDAEAEYLRRRGQLTTENRRIVCVDLKSGRETWTADKRIFGTWLGYSEEFDVLIQAGSAAGDRALDEVGAGIVAYKGIDGSVLWESDSKYSGPLLLHHDTIYSQPGPGYAFHLLTGKRKTRIHPLSGDTVEWTYGRDGGCNTAICSEHMITFRSSAAGYFDLAGDSGTGNWGGFRSSCTSNLIPADGVLNAPDYTRTCTCAFQNRTSLALVHMPEIETWTFNRFKWDGKRVRNLGLNFGAPGDHRSPSGLLWLDYPSVGGDSPDVPVTVEGDAVEYFRFHPSRISGDSLNWVSCCGIKGASTIKISLDSDENSPKRPYTVRLYFAELEANEVEKRVFDVQLQNETVLSNLDISKEAGGPNRSVMKEFQQVQAGRDITIHLTPIAGKTVLCGAEIVAEGW